MDHSKFEDVENELNGRTIVNKLIDDFKILSQFRIIKEQIPPISYASCIDLEVLIKETMDYHILVEKQWEVVERLGRTRYKIPSKN